MASSNTRHQSLVYLITYSRADLDKVSSRETFAMIIANAFQQVAQVEVNHWVVCKESHAETSESENSTHYHMALKLNKRSRWSRVRQYIQNHHDIRVNFSCNHNTYYSAHQYVIKEDKEFAKSADHPILTDPPSTEQAITANRKRSTKNKGDKKKAKRYSTFDVVQIIQEQNIKTRLELVNLAVVQKNEGKTQLAQFIANRGAKVVNEALELAKEFVEAPMQMQRLKMSRIDILNEAYGASCVTDCNGQWLEMALTLMSQNELSVSAFCSGIFKALKDGRGKYRNIYVYGPANTGKTFIISPLKNIYKTFTNPATGTFAWLGVEDAEVVVLNDFRWHPSVIAWGDLLQLLEGDTVHLPVPKNFGVKDVEFNKNTPFFATADAPMVLVKGGSLDSANTQMMQVRWRTFNFWKQIPQDKQKSLSPCQHCFAKFVLDYKDIDNLF